MQIQDVFHYQTKVHSILRSFSSLILMLICLNYIPRAKIMNKKRIMNIM